MGRKAKLLIGPGYPEDGALLSYARDLIRHEGATLDQFRVVAEELQDRGCLAALEVVLEAARRRAVDG